MDLHIAHECTRLGLEEHARDRLCEMLDRFESIESERVPDSLYDVPVTKVRIRRQTRFQILSVMKAMESNASRRSHLVFLSHALASLPIFQERVRRDGLQGPEFWDPLLETLPRFVNRCPSLKLRRYTLDAPLQAHDVLCARVFGILSLEPSGAPS